MKGFLILTHRWLGVALCAFVFVWFVSGIGMMYFTFPEVSASDRLERAASLEAARIRVSPVQAAAKVGGDLDGADVVLNTFDGRPVYRFSMGRRVTLVYADTGDLQPRVSRALTDRIASSWVHQPVDVARAEQVNDVDQWTVLPSVRRRLPLTKYSWPNGEEVYVAPDGEVVQHTTSATRLQAYLGPIPHWLYFTSLRKHSVAWSRVVVWTSGAVTLSALLGLTIGVWVYSPSRRYRVDGVATSVPYRGQKRWHMCLGLVFGIATVTWAFSGMLSMEPFPLSSSAPPPIGLEIQDALGGPASAVAFDAKSPQAALDQLGGRFVKELRLRTFAGEPFYLATLADGTTVVVPVVGQPRSSFGQEQVVSALARVVSPGHIIETRVVDEYDRYYLDRHRRLPLPVIVATLDDADHTRAYVDPATARVVGGYSDRDWVSRWLYNGLHSFNFPWLYNHRPLWDVVVIAFMLGGALLAMTSIALAWQVIARTVSLSKASKSTAS